MISSPSSGRVSVFRRFISGFVAAGPILVLILAGCATAPSGRPPSGAPGPSAESGPSDKVFDPRDVSQQPVPTVQRRPMYPVELQKDSAGGQVLVDFIVTTDGTVANAYALKATNQAFAVAAVTAVSNWKFRPGRKDGQPVNVHMQVPIVFTLNRGGPQYVPASPLAGTDFGPGDDQVPTLPIGSVDRQPLPRYQQRPRYPSDLRERGLQGQAVVDFVVDENGFARNLRIASATHPEFGVAAKEAVAHWIFTPGTKDGALVRTHMQVPIVFALGAN